LGGDYYLFSTTAGTVLMIRQQSASGHADKPNPQTCDDVDMTNVPYVTVGPTLLQLYLTLASTGWACIEPDRSYSATQPAFVFLRRDGQGGLENVAHATCTSVAMMNCTMHTERGTLGYSGSFSVEPGDFKSYLPKLALPPSEEHR
jgi:hypothetical protein